MQRLSIIIALSLIVVAFGLLIWKSQGSSKTTQASASPSPTPTASPDDVQVDNEDGAQVVITYRADLSATQAVFDVDITKTEADLTKYDYKRNFVLADTNINPLPLKDIKTTSITPAELKAEVITNKYRGDHFHFIVRNLAGIQDRVVHFYRTI
jgi:hypothetical protein